MKENAQSASNSLTGIDDVFLNMWLGKLSYSLGHIVLSDMSESHVSVLYSTY